MNKKILAGIIIIIIGISIYYFSTRPSDNEIQNISEEPSNIERVEGAGSYEAYDASKLANANSGDVVLFFRAAWCPTCRALDADIRSKLGGIPADLTILDVDYDNSTELKQKYGVTYQHTFVQVDAQGNLIKKWTNSPTLAALVMEIQ